MTDGMLAGSWTDRLTWRGPRAAMGESGISEYAWSSDRFFRTGNGPAWLDLDDALPSS